MEEVEEYDRSEELRAFDETKAGVKGLHDSGVTTIPRIFKVPPTSIATPSSGAPTTDAAIPTIDLSRPTEELVVEVRKAASEWGFFRVVGHGVPLEVMEGAMRGTGRFFGGDLEEKKKYHSRDLGRKVRWNSNFDLYNSSVANWRDTFAVSMAPDTPKAEEIPAAFRESIMGYWKHVSKMGELLFELLSKALGLDPSYLKNMECCAGQDLFLHYYPPCPQPKLAIGTSAHSDNSFLTILVQDQIGGLQILHQNQWVDVSPLHEAFVVNIGDLLQLISNDKFVSVEHRVLANEKDLRMSVALFFRWTSSNVVYGPIKELLSEDNPPRYRGTLLRDYSKHYNAKGLRGKGALFDMRI